MQRHEWRERTEDGLRFHRAEYHSGRWQLLTQLKGDENWERKEEMTREEWMKLREILWNKYQRKRVPWEFIERIDKRLAKMDEEGDD
jgi:hypothetical protein